MMLFAVWWCLFAKVGILFADLFFLFAIYLIIFAEIVNILEIQHNSTAKNSLCPSPMTHQKKRLVLS